MRNGYRIIDFISIGLGLAALSLLVAHWVGLAEVALHVRWFLGGFLACAGLCGVKEMLVSYIFPASG